MVDILVCEESGHSEVVVTFLNAQGETSDAIIDLGNQAAGFNADTAITVLLPTS
ncbi:MAG: hypothetical protein P1U83_19335 [Roseovarius sp.]|nr:hypothetical protein [Roseovarius sp.]